MKKIYVLVVLLSVMGLMSCKHEAPSVTVLHLNSAILEVGDSLLLHIDCGSANSIRDITFTPASEGAICKVVPTGKKNLDATVYAMSPGFDTITINYVYTMSIFDYGEWSTMAIEVKEKQSED